METTQLLIPVADLNGSVTWCPIEAECLNALFAVHPVYHLDAAGAALRPDATWFTVTHRASGYRVVSTFLTQQQARRFAAALPTLRVKWAFADIAEYAARRA